MGRVKLTEIQQKQAVADYIECHNYSAVARKYGVADMTIRRIVEQSDVDVLKCVEEKG